MELPKFQCVLDLSARESSLSTHMCWTLWSSQGHFGEQEHILQGQIDLHSSEQNGFHDRY